MSRTYKTSYGKYRPVRGHKQAKIKGARQKAIPPSSWEDIPYDKQCDVPYKVALALHKKGWEKERIIKHIRQKFKMDLWLVEKYMPFFDYWWGCDCEQCKKNFRFGNKQVNGILELYEENPHKEPSNIIVRPWR